MKKLVLVLLATLGFSVNAADLKIGIVDLAIVFQQSPQKEAIQQKLSDEFKERVDEIKSKEKNIQQLEEKLNRDKLTMSMKESQEISRKIEELMVEHRLKAKQFQEDKRRREGEETRNLMTSIQRAVEAVSKAEKLDLVFRRDQVAFMSSKAKDITPLVVSKLK